MADFSDSDYVPVIKNRIYGVDSAIIIVVLASALFWLSVGIMLWLYV